MYGHDNIALSSSCKSNLTSSFKINNRMNGFSYSDYNYSMTNNKKQSIFERWTMMLIINLNKQKKWITHITFKLNKVIMIEKNGTKLFFFSE